MHSPDFKKVGPLAFHNKPITQLRRITCHMGPHSTC